MAEKTDNPTALETGEPAALVADLREEEALLCVDLHDMGKNLFRDLLERHGFTVLDLGVDVPPADFIAAELDLKLTAFD